MSKTTKRDYNVEKSFRKEINLSTKYVASKKAYKRKPKHPPKDY